MYVDKPMIVFLDRLASRSPEPGGGSVAALTAALGAALVSMVGNLTLGKEKYASVQGEIEELLKASEQARSDLQDLLQQDTEVYASVSEAFKMPRDTAEEKEARRVKVQEGLKAATEVPFRITEKCAEVARLSLVAGEIGNVGAVSDAGVAVLLAEAAAQSGALNVKINIGSIEDEEYCASRWARVQEILEETAELRERVMRLTYERLG